MTDQATPGQVGQKPANTELAKITEGQKVVNPNDPNAIFSPAGLKQALAVCANFLASGSLPASYKNAPQVLMAVQLGRELGMKPVESLNGMMIINGQIKLWGTALTGRVTKLGYKIKWGACDDKSATVSIISPDGEETEIETYTAEEAKAAGLMGKQNWRAHTKTMLRWRALGNAVKFNYPHLLQGCSLVEDDDDVDEVQGEFKVVNEDNASKLLNKEVEDDMAKEIEEKTIGKIKRESALPVNKAEIKEEMKPGEIGTVAYIPENEVRDLEALMKEVGTKVEAVEKHYNKKLRVFSPNDAKELRDKLEEKKEILKKEDEKKKPKPPATKATIKEAPTAKADVQKMPADVCQYINSIEKVGDNNLPTDIVMLRLDSSRGTFKGIAAYPSLVDEMKNTKAEAGEAPAEIKTQAPTKTVDITMEVLEVVNDLAAHDPSELSEDQKKLIDDCNNNKFLGEETYPGVKF